MKNSTPEPLSTRTSTLLRPDQLATQAAHAVRELLAEATSAHTTRSYASALRYWAAWYQGRYGQAIALPVPEPVALQFLVDHLARRTRRGLTWELPADLDTALVSAGLKQRLGPFKHSTIVHRMAVLSKVHQLRKLENPCAAPAVRQVLAQARRAALKRGERPRKKTAITRPELEAMVATCDGTLEGLRDRALLYFGFASGGRRRSEIAAAEWSDLRVLSEEGFLYRLEHSKTHQAGTDTPDKPVLGRAGQALGAWLTAADITEGALFRRVWQNKRVGERLSPAAVAAIIQRRAVLAGLSGDFGGHSLRSGFVTEGGRQGVPFGALMAMTEHRSLASITGYFHAGSVQNNPAARLLDD